MNDKGGVAVLDLANVFAPIFRFLKLELKGIYSSIILAGVYCRVRPIIGYTDITDTDTDNRYRYRYDFNNIGIGIGLKFKLLIGICICLI